VSKLDKPEISGQKLGNKPGTFVKGDDPRRNLAGRPEGSGYKQKFEAMLCQVAEEKGMTREQAELELFKTAYDQAVKGNYQFFKDYVDRAYGPVKTNDTNIQVNNVIPLLGGDSVQTHDGNREVVETQQAD
jgi:hypothetical protein